MLYRRVIRAAISPMRALEASRAPMVRFAAAATWTASPAIWADAQHTASVVLASAFTLLTPPPLIWRSSRSQGGERELQAQAGPRAVRAVQRNPAAERLDAVLDADQAGTAGEVGTADAVVLDRDA